jgi:hypothetical protein
MSLFEGIPDTLTRGGAASQNVAPSGASSTSAAPIKTSPREKLPRTPMDAIEQGIVRKLQGYVTFVPASSHKRFIHDLIPDRSQLSDRGRAYLAYIAHRYRRQWKATHEEFCWIVRWASYGTLPRPRPDSQCR